MSDVGDVYTVLFVPDNLKPPESILGFMCRADDVPDAANQCHKVYKKCEVLWVRKGDSFQEALDEYAWKGVLCDE